MEKIHGNSYLYFWSNDGLQESQKIRISFDIERDEHSNINYSDLDPSKYLLPYSLVPVGDQFYKIIESNDLKGSNMHGVYEYVLNGMHYGKPKSTEDKYYHAPWLSEDGRYGLDKVTRDDVVNLYKISKEINGDFTFGNGNSLYACDIGVGNCTDYHSYFLSISRTLNVPARFHMGFFIPKASDGKVGGYHCWADYYVDNEGWYPVDISEADKNPDRKDYYFGTVCENRLEMVVGRDFILEGYESGSINLFIYPIMEVNDKKSSAFSKHFTYKNL